MIKIEIERMVDTAASAQSIIDMFFLEHAYGTPAESYALSHRIVQLLADEGRLS